MSDVDSALAGMAGDETPGGCPDCAAVQRLVQHAPGVYVLVVAHDGTCPAYQRISREMTS